MEREKCLGSNGKYAEPHLSKEYLLEELQFLIEEEGCYGEVLNISSLAWTKYKGKTDEMMNAFWMLADDLINQSTAKMMLKNEHTQGFLNLESFPMFRKKIIEIANKK